MTETDISKKIHKSKTKLQNLKCKFKKLNFLFDRSEVSKSKTY